MKGIIGFLACCAVSISGLAQIPETESNGTFNTANSIQAFNNVMGTVGNSDTADFFRTVFPADGTLKIFISITNITSNNGYVNISLYDRAKSLTTSQFVSSASVPGGVTVFDSIILYGQAADTAYFRLTSSQLFSYQFHYFMDDQSPNDNEPNNSFATSSPVAMSEIKQGHTNYEANGGTLDPDDYYRTIFPADGTLKVYVKATNRGGASGYISMNGYDRRKTVPSFSGFLSANVPAGTTVYDTVTLHGQAADTFYFRLFSSKPFAYEFRYELADQSPNDNEPNNSFATSSPVAMSETKQGHTNYEANGGTPDPDDYYRTIFPADGTLKVYVKATNRGGASGYISMNGYDRRKTVPSFSGFLFANVPAGTTVYDTVTLHGQAADTFYFRLFSSKPFAYEFRYELADQSPNDNEPNNSFATSSPVAMSETKQGHTNYEANGGTPDPDDYYRTIFPADGTLKVYVKATNRGGASGYISMNGYDRRKTVPSFSGFLSTSVPAGTTVYDTVTLHGQAADTFYFRLFSTKPFAYEFRYEMIDTSLNDVEPNNTFAESIVLSGAEIKPGHTGYSMNGTYDQFDYYKTEFASTDSLKLYIQATNYSSTTGNFTLRGYNSAQTQIYSRVHNNVAPGASFTDSVKILVTAPQTIYNRLESVNDAFSYQLNLNSHLPGNGFIITGNTTACNTATIYKAMDVADPDVTYHWTLVSGGTLNFTDSIATVTWITPGTHLLKLYLSNSYGNSVTKQIAVLVNDSVPSAAPVVTVKGRYLDIPAVSAGTQRLWFKDGVSLGVNDSVYYAATAGSYTAKYINNCGEGPASSPAIVFNAPQTQTISFPSVSAIGFGVDSFRVLTATATSGLPITYRIISGPGLLRNDSLFVTATGTIVVQAQQFGNINYGEATPVNVSVTVVKGPQVITFNAVPNKIYPGADFALDAFSSSGLPITYAVVSGPATLTGAVLKMTGVGTVQVKAMQGGNTDYLAATDVTQIFCTGIRQLADTIAGVKNLCPATVRYSIKKITGALYQWSLSGGGILSSNADTATVQWTAPGAYTLSVKAYSACDTVRSTAQTITVNVFATYQTGAVTGLTPVDNATGLSLPLTLQWAPVTNAAAYDVYVWPSGLPEPLFPLDSNLSQVNYTLNSNIALNTAYSWKVVAKNVCSSSASVVQQFTVSQNSSGKPDLIMDTISYQANICQGLPLTVTWRVKNNGINGTGLATWKDRIYLSPTNSLRVSESTLLGAYDNPSYLLPGETYTQTKTVTVPPGLAGGWYLFVITDNGEAFCFTSACNIFWGEGRYNHSHNTVQESNEYNNYRYNPIVVLDGPLPDLRVQSAAVPGSASGGSTITVTYSVKNEGAYTASGVATGGCPQRSWIDRIFISDQPTFNINNAQELPGKLVRFLKPGTTNCVTETLPYIDYLLPDSSYTMQHQVTLPYNYSGPHYFYVYTNGYNDAYEGPFSTNNIRRTDSINITLTPPADLIVSNVPNPGTILSGQLVDFNFTVTNQGANAPYESYWRDSVFICRTPVLNYDSVVVKGVVNRNRPANFTTGATYNGACRLAIPNGITGGFYVHVKADARKEVFEYNQESNNSQQSTVFSVLLSPPVDLTINSISLPDTVTVGVPFTVAYTLKNNGTGTVKPVWKDFIYANTDSEPAANNGKLGEVSHSGSDSLQAGVQKTYLKSVVISTSAGLANRQAFIKIKTDAADNIYEHNAEGNNLFVQSSSVFVLPSGANPAAPLCNIALDSLTAPASVNANTSLAFSWKVKNHGPAATTKTYWQDRLYLSADSVITNADLELKRISVNQYTNTGLMPDSQYVRSGTVQIPLALFGNYYLIVTTNHTGTITNDSTDTDNKIIRPISIIAAPAPDLAITPLNNLPDSVWGGSVFYLKYSVQNTGPVTAQSHWYDRVYIQPNSAPNTSPAAYKLHTTPLAPGASYTDSMLVQVPVYLNGNYNFILHADGRNDLFEGPGGEANNINARLAPVYPFNSRPAPDLVVSTVSVPDSAILGKNITANYSITNIGSHPAAGNVDNSFYLSLNPIFESSLDKLTANNQLTNFSLQPGQSYGWQLTGRALPYLPGSHRSIVRTNVRNTLFEGAATNNNVGVSDSATHIDALSLQLGVTKADTLIPGEGVYYKVTVGDSLDLLVNLTTPYAGDGSNAVYVARNRVADETSYDATGFNPSVLNQTVLLSNTQAGTYYIKAQSFAIAVNEPVSLTVSVIPFSILHVTPSVMGKGNVSGWVYGGGFKPGTQLKLRKNGTDYNVGTIQQFVNSTKLKMLWQLAAVPTGVYDVVAVNPGNVETVLANAVTVETALEYKLEYTKLLPSGLRPFGGIFTFKGKNIGNVNIPVLQGDITMIEKNATVHSVSTTGPIRRFTQYFPQRDSLVEQDWYLTGKNRAVPYIGRNIAPGEEFTITVETRFKGTNVLTEQDGIFPLQDRVIGYSSTDFVKELIRSTEMIRLLLANDSRVANLPNSIAVQDSRAGSKVFIEKVMNEYVIAGLMDWSDTIGLNTRWDCSRCLQGLSEFKNAGNSQDTFSFSPAGEMIVGKDSVGTGQVFGKNKKMLIEMNKGRYWWYYDGRAGASGQPGENKGWDLLDIHGTLFIDATPAEPFKIYLSSMRFESSTQKNQLSQLGGWNPAYDTSYLIVVATGGINGYDSSKLAIDLTYFSNLNDMRRGHFTTELRRGFGLGPDSIMLVWKAYKPTWGEAGVDGVDGGPGEPGSPGGKGGPGNAQNQKGGKGGKGGRGSDEISIQIPAMPGGRGGDGGEGYGPGGDGGDAGETGNSFSLCGVDGEEGGQGSDAGPNGGNGGGGGTGGKGGKGGLDCTGGDGGKGGDGGNGVNSSYGGNGGKGGDGGPGGFGCGGGKRGGNGGNGGFGGQGPLGLGNDGAGGKKGITGTSIDCPPCGDKPKLTGPDAKKAAESLIDYGKAAYGGAGSLALEVLNQTTNENAPSVNLAVQSVDLIVATLTVANPAALEYMVITKGTSFLINQGDYYVSQIFYNGKDYPLRTEVKFLKDFFSTISSVPDFVAFGAKQMASLGLDMVSPLSMEVPCDPNEITGPAGYERERFVSAKAIMPYTIHFENDSLAQVAAQRVVVRQPISIKADPVTFRLGSFNFGGHSFEVPADRSNYFAVLNFDSLGYRVEVSAGVDIVNREAFWILQAIDPATGMPPANAFAGFLPPNDSTEKGTGFVTYSIKPVSSAVTGDSVTAKASIVFDVNEPIETNTWVNIIDAFPPTSSLNGLPQNTSMTAIPVYYSGIDDLGGSGLKNVDLYVSVNNSLPELWARAFTGTDTIYTGERGKTYKFYGSAVDNVGNRETLTLIGTVTVRNEGCIGNDFSFTSNLSGSSYQWQVNTGSGFVNISNGGIYQGTDNQTLYIIHAPGNMAGTQYRCFVNGNFSQTYYVRFTSVWEGVKSTAWEDPGNWSCGVVPNEYTDVLIVGGMPYNPVVNANTAIRSLQANPGASITVGSGVAFTIIK